MRATPVRIAGWVGRVVVPIWWTRARWWFVVVVGMDLGLALYGRPLWWGRWTATMDWLGGDSLLLGPLFAALAAYVAWRDRVQLSEVVGDSPARRRRAALTSAGGLLVMISAAHLLVQTLIIAWSLLMWGLPPAHSWSVLLAPFGGYAAYVAIGYALGLVVRSPAAPVLAGVVVLMFPTLGPGLHLPSRYWEHGGASGVTDLLKPVGWVSLAQFLLGMGLLVACLAFAAMRQWRPLWLNAVGTVGLATSVAAGATLAGDPDRFEPASEPLAVACAPGAVEVCVAESHHAQLPSLSRQLARVADEMQRVGYHWPVTQVRQIVAAQISDLGSTQRGFLLDRPWEQPFDLMDEILMPTRCRAGRQYLRFARARSDAPWWAVEWFAYVAADKDPAAVADGAGYAEDLEGWTAARRSRFLVRTLHAMDQCDPSLLPGSR